MRLPGRFRPAPRLRGRTRSFRGRSHPRFWWYQLERATYVPPVMAGLSRSEWRLMERWFHATRWDRNSAQLDVPGISLLHGLIAGSAIQRVVQLGHYKGYSALLLGFLLRSMGDGKLVSFDIDPESTAVARRWVSKAGLADHVTVLEGDSGAPAATTTARELLGGPPQLALIDSAHSYSHTLTELDLWSAEIPVGGFIALHDVSRGARGLDPTGQGGVGKALSEWLAGRPDMSAILINDFVASLDDYDLVYADPVGLGIVQRRS